MRTPFIVGIFGLAVAVAGFTEWASRRTAATDINGPQTAMTSPSALSPEAPDTASAMSRTAAARPALAETTDSTARVLVLGDTGGVFRLNAVTLSDEMVAKIDDLLSGPDRDELLCGRFVIEGHTDNLGTKETNDRIGFARAFAVRKYLNERYDIPREAMKIASYGSDRPVGDNATPEGRALNRRVVIKVIPDSH
jgi:outer membrane protein OmpA-like peptidoglycan-associated protein